jgi:hypothetical protein
MFSSSTLATFLPDANRFANANLDWHSGIRATSAVFMEDGHFFLRNTWESTLKPGTVQ